MINEILVTKSPDLASQISQVFFFLLFAPMPKIHTYRKLHQ